MANERLRELRQRLCENGDYIDVLGNRSLGGDIVSVVLDGTWDRESIPLLIEFLQTLIEDAKPSNR